MTCEDKPAIGLRFHNACNAHSACKANNGHHSDAGRDFVTHHLCTAAHSTDKGVFTVT